VIWQRKLGGLRGDTITSKFLVAMEITGKEGIIEFQTRIGERKERKEKMKTQGKKSSK